MIRKSAVTVTVAGADGSATGSAQFGPVAGRVLAVHLDYTDQPATADVTVATVSPAVTVLTVANNATDGWHYPRQLMDGTNGAALTGVYEAIAVADHVNVSVAQGNAGSVVATLIWDDGR